MPHPCTVCGRSRMNPNNRAEEYTFFGFPVNDEERCQKWLEFCCREELYKLSKKQLLQRMICSKHFEDFNFVNQFYDRLNNTAVPSIYDPKQSLYSIGCVLCGRFRKDPPGPENDGATFHHFPGEEFRCLKWLDFVGVDSYYRLTRKEIMFCYICSRHFDKSQFMEGFYNRLIKDAVPNIRNPDDEEEEEEILDIKKNCIKIENQEDVKRSENSSKKVELFQSPTESIKILNPLPMAVLESQACAACGRSRTDPKNKIEKFKFHPFPAYEIGRCLKWCQFLGREDILKMSPNQIRRLVLCSGHFKADQNFNSTNTPCDAVPTIHDYTSDIEIVAVLEDKDEPVAEGNKPKIISDKIFRASVSSKKPKMDPQNKPMPLAKKRGKSKRPTQINIPKVETRYENFTVRKLPIPTVSNWKLIANQFQPINVSSSIVNNTSSEIKKVILPFPGNISNLGAPIPVNSLSSMPPGLLIKINLPEQEKSAQKKRKIKEEPETDSIRCAQVQNDNLNKHIIVQNVGSNLVYYSKPKEEIKNCNSLKQEIAFDECSDNGMENCDDEVYTEDIKEEEIIIEEKKSKLKPSGRCKRTMLPIRNELKRFLHKLKPHVKRLPKKSRAQVKLAIVNMVIEQL